MQAEEAVQALVEARAPQVNDMDACGIIVTCRTYVRHRLRQVARLCHLVGHVCGATGLGSNHDGQWDVCAAFLSRSWVDGIIAAIVHSRLNDDLDDTPLHGGPLSENRSRKRQLFVCGRRMALR